LELIVQTRLFEALTVWLPLSGTCRARPPVVMPPASVLGQLRHDGAAVGGAGWRPLPAELDTASPTLMI
jgi:hypothetical protein